MSAPITKRILPKGREYGRPGYAMTPTSITIHNTANERADAEAHARYLEAGHAISWHYTVDADSIIQHLPITEQGWHTGTHEGNTTSVGIEVCEYPATDEGKALQAKAEDNAAWLAAKLLDENPSIRKVVTHKFWSGKECPRDILPHWAKFIAAVRLHEAAMVPDASPKHKPAPMPLLRHGSTGGAVRTLQRALTKAGAKDAAGHVLVDDGDFGLKTLTAVRAWQKRKKLVVDGIVGAATWKSLGY